MLENLDEHMELSTLRSLEAELQERLGEARIELIRAHYLHTMVQARRIELEKTMQP